MTETDRDRQTGYRERQRETSRRQIVTQRDTDIDTDGDKQT